MSASRIPGRPLGGLRASILDNLAAGDDTDLVAELRRALDRTRGPAAELWEKYRGSRSAPWGRRLAGSAD